MTIAVFVFSILCILGCLGLVVVVGGPLVWIVISLLVFCLAGLLFLYVSVIRPQSVVRNGMNLIAAQDFNNRLIKTGVPEADKIVLLFNTMIDKLRGERLENRERENFLQLLVAASPMGVLMLDFDERCKMANEAFLKITGISSEKEIIGRDLDQLPTDLASAMCGVQLGTSQVITRGDIRMYRCYHLSFVQLGFIREFYLLESLTEEVMKAERRAYEKVIRTISHEVNNTMGGVKSVLGILSDTCDDEDINKVIESCDNRCDRMCSFVSSYADVVRVPDPVLREHDLNSELDRMIPFVRMMMKEGVKLEFIKSDDPIQVMIDSNLIQQVILNVLKNAVESIEGRGKIVISTFKEGTHGVVEIMNDGKPITDDAAKNLFRPFFSTKHSGRGLGLTLVSEILNRHNARYSLRTGADGLTRFRIEFNK